MKRRKTRQSAAGQNPKEVRKVKPRCPQCGIRKDLYDSVTEAKKFINIIYEEYGVELQMYACRKKWHLASGGDWRPGHWAMPKPQLL